jgi:2-polyprenyl-3-methyl-5-hydroxy-6-metoxy-1,4-benzoquinol methylase
MTMKSNPSHNRLLPRELKWKLRLFLLLVVFSLSFSNAFHPSSASQKAKANQSCRYKHHHHRQPPTLSSFAIFAAKGFGASAPKKKAPNQKAILKQLTKTYGGTSSEQIARGTQQIMNQRMKRLSAPLQLALQLFQQSQQWNFRVQDLSVSEQTKVLSPEDVQGAARAKEELEKLMTEEGLTKKDLHNLLQVMTWDASADAKAARSVTGTMPRDIQLRLETASEIVAEAVGSDGRCLDVGCGFGVMVPFLAKAGIDLNQMYGIDLSPEMIRNANELHAGVTFEAGDFFQYTPPQEKLFEAVIFCSSLHDLPDTMAALDKAVSLLQPGGKLVLLHAQGASHVINQVKLNPVLVPRGLATISELEALEGVRVLVAPATTKSKEESKDGYLAVLERV